MLNKKIEVFKTNVEDENVSQELLIKIHTTFPHYSANFDLEDCDRILRVESKNNKVKSLELIELFIRNGHKAEIL